MELDSWLVKLSGASVTPTSHVCMTAMLVLLIAVN
jgi:hypothetical protein